ncbi:threonine ammonia-lyase [Carboxylicivirga sp. M1479]|uniref:threonine ammonia-lyase n=1 Tax=Carboxylicivirga sp. M1479 TaxID=2594476 RepID=UPI0011781371|nr:threonine ammonia-lyase [Carboxylicivirga sp. M1479]TRX71003.1 threonine ammonia-lyase [Carboxylicivirga sp. M1479]
MTKKNKIAAFSDYYPSLEAVKQAKETISEVVETTPLMRNRNLSKQFCANVSLKREDLQAVRSYKIRGAYNKIKSLTKQQVSGGIVCSSAGNHAQGVAFSCKELHINGYIYMPTTTPKQKVSQVKMFGQGFVEVVLKGDTYDDAYNAAMDECARTGRTFIHPFDDPQIIEGQATVGLEIYEQADKPIDYIFIPIGGGGLASGLGAYIKQITPETKIIGVEPAGAPAMQQAMEKGEVVELPEIDKFVDGAAVQRVGSINLPICQRVLDDIILVPEGKICTKILELYNYEAIVVEPAGALSIAALDYYADQIIGKNVVCVLSGSNNDITRTEEIKERSLLYEGLKHYFIVRFPQRAGALKTFVGEVLGPTDDITHFEYKKKTARAMGPVVIGIEVQKPEDFNGLQERMERHGFVAEYLNEKPDLFQYLI